jgi:hypothetical protein
MSVDRSIGIDIFVEDKSVGDCLKLLFEGHWTPFDKSGQIHYLPTGEMDSSRPVTTDDVNFLYKVIEEKGRKREFNLVYIWDKHYEEASTLVVHMEDKHEIYNHFRLTFSLGTAKRLKGSNRHTDYSHYLENIVPLLEAHEYIMESITCTDFG